MLSLLDENWCSGIHVYKSSGWEMNSLWHWLKSYFYIFLMQFFGQLGQSLWRRWVVQLHLSQFHGLSRTAVKRLINCKQFCWVYMLVKVKTNQVRQDLHWRTLSCVTVIPWDFISWNLTTFWRNFFPAFGSLLPVKRKFRSPSQGFPLSCFSSPGWAVTSNFLSNPPRSPPTPHSGSAGNPNEPFAENSFSSISNDIFRDPFGKTTTSSGFLA